MATMGRPRKISSPQEMYEKWQEFKQECDTKTCIRTEFSQKLGKFVTQTITSPVSYTVLGFSLFIGITDDKFRETYSEDKDFRSIVSMIERECEEDVRRKFENKTIPSQLSGLWMSKFGYGTKQETEIKGSIPVVVTGEDNIPE